MSEAFDVVVIGAGMAGLVAARGLAERGLRVCVVEARERVGGRVWSQAVEGGGVVELGAEFVHGRSAELWALIDEAGLRTVEREGASVTAGEDGLEAEDDGDDERFEPLEALKEFQGEDVSFAEWMKGAGLEAAAQAELTAFVEGFNAADAKLIGVKGLGAQQAAEDASEGMRAWHVVGGYQQIAEFLAGELKRLGVELRLGCAVSAVSWSAGDVVVEVQKQVPFRNDKTEVRARKCVVTLPLSVVQNVNRQDGIQMQPEPKAVAAAKGLVMGRAVRFTMVFCEPWWLKSAGLTPKTLEGMNFLFTPGKMPPVWWVGDAAHAEDVGLPTLTGWAGGPRAASLEGKSAEAMGVAASGNLAAAFGVSAAVVRGALVGTYAHDWSGDAFSQGAYSYVAVGGLGASMETSQPEAETMFFAGEHTDVSANWGTVHAAVRSGLRVVEQVVGEA